MLVASGRSCTLELSPLLDERDRLLDDFTAGAYLRDELAGAEARARTPSPRPAPAEKRAVDDTPTEEFGRFASAR